MADAFTGTGQISSDTTAYEIAAYFALRPQLYFDNTADIKPTNQSHRGSAVQFTKYNDLAAQTTELSETADPDAIAASDATISVTLREYGMVLKTTAKARAVSFLDLDSDVANLIGFNAGISVDTLARDVLEAGTNATYAGTATARNNVTPSDKLKATNARRMRADLVEANVMPIKGVLYTAYAHPDVLFDLREETGAASWRDPHVYSAVENIWTGEFGSFEGFVWIETPRAPKFADAGSSPTTTDVFATLFMGRQALAIAHASTEGFARYPTIVKGPRVDALQRIQPLGWKTLRGNSRFREESLRRVESAATGN